MILWAWFESISMKCHGHLTLLTLLSEYWHGFWTCWIALEKLRFFIFKSKMLFPHFNWHSYNSKAINQDEHSEAKGLLQNCYLLNVIYYILEWLSESTANILCTRLNANDLWDTEIKKECHLTSFQYRCTCRIIRLTAISEIGTIVSSLQLRSA